ncbi:hypothetical protein E4U54_005948 [Claviceps lovelessii]|nr:hypothetical protein E4U54_005948 [Claviceps lovelessii]
MLKQILIPLVVLGTAPLALARNCKPGLNYCGHTLIGIGNYRGQIAQALSAAGQSGNDVNVNHSLFHCEGGPEGVIRFIDFCRYNCVDNGSGRSDYCDQRKSA